MSSFPEKNEIQARIIVQGIPFDRYSSYKRGPAQAPEKIREALFSGSANLWSESGFNIGADNVLFDAGDLNFSSDKDVFEEIELSVSKICSDKKKPLLLGGDHSITYPIIKAISRYFPKLTILHFDAHPDLYDEYDGNKLSHACPFARIMEEGLVECLIQVGIRTLNAHQREQVERFGVKIIEMKDLPSDLVLNLSSPLYISFDMDCIDPGFAPGVSHWEPGGMSSRQVIEIIQSISANIVGADIVEFNPEVESDLTATVAAKILKEMAGKMLEKDLY